MATSYPEGWVSRVERAEKLSFDPSTGLYHSPDGRQEVTTDVVAGRTDEYLKAEAARRKKRLSRDDEQLCREYVLLVANWRTGAWERRQPTPRSSKTAAREPGKPRT